MQRPTQTELDLQILDAAGGLFATQGFERTSVQQVADAVGYSKTGLLHRFPSKLALLNALEDVIDDKVAEVRAAITTIPSGPARQQTYAAMLLISERTVAWPGGLSYLMSSIAVEPTEPSSLLEIMELLMSLAGTAGEEATFRMSLALETICVGSRMGTDPDYADLKRRLPLLLAETATAIIHPAPTPTA